MRIRIFIVNNEGDFDFDKRRRATYSKVINKETLLMLDKYQQQEMLAMPLLEWCEKFPVPKSLQPCATSTHTSSAADSRVGSQSELKSIFPGADWIYIDDASELLSARHFELIPLHDGGNIAFPVDFYSGDMNTIQIRMGKDQHPSILVATYTIEDSAKACEEFFDLVRFSTALWYDGYDIRCRVRSIEDLANRIVEDRFEEGDTEFGQLLDALGLEPEDLDMTNL